MAPEFEEFDDYAWDHGDALYKAFKDNLHETELYYDLGDVIMKHYMRRDAIEICAPQKGAFHVYYRLRFASTPGAIIRIAIPAYFQYQEEKLMGEIATMRYIADHTTITVPFVYHYGTQDECPGQLGPFMIMDWIENEGDCVDVLNTPGFSLQDAPVLDPDINEHKLGYMYSQLAEVLLQLSQCHFPAIGSLGFGEGGDASQIPQVTSRPLSLDLAQLANFARIPDQRLPDRMTTFKTSSSYYSVLADLHLEQLSFQRNQAIRSAEDCRKKYIARQLFRKLAAEGRLAQQEYDQGPFILWCDDLRPANVLVKGNDQLAAVIDWEFSYAAPAEFTFSPPWWLLLRAPEDWKHGLDDWVANYEPKLAIFLRALKAKEAELAKENRLNESMILSERMSQSWQSGQFWVTYAARRTWAFDAIYWRYLDEKFFGKGTTSYRDRLDLLPRGQVDGMEEFVQRKLKEKEEATLVDWYEPGAANKLPPDILHLGPGGSARTTPGGLAPTQQGSDSVGASNWI